MIGETWTCHICGRERPDQAISVMVFDTSENYGLPPGTMKQNVRYCNDNPECWTGAQTKRFVRPTTTGDQP